MILQLWLSFCTHIYGNVAAKKKSQIVLFLETARVAMVAEYLDTILFAYLSAEKYWKSL